MYKSDKRLTSDHLTEKGIEKRLKGIKKLPDVSDKAEEINIDFEKAGLLKKINARKAMSQKQDESNVV